MAELDDKLLKNLDKTLQSMNQRLQGLEQTLAGVKEGMVSAFNPAIIKSFTDSMRGLKAIRLIEADEAVKDIKKIKDEIDSLESKYKGEKPLKKGESLGSVREELSRYKAVMREIDKGSEQRAIELANIRQKERDADLKAAEVVVSQREQAERRKSEIARAWAEQEAREKAQREKMKTAAEKAAADERIAIAEAEAKKKSEIAKAWAEQDRRRYEKDGDPLGEIAARKGLTGTLAALEDQTAVNEWRKQTAEEQKRIAKEEAEVEKQIKKEMAEEEKKLAAEEKQRYQDAVAANKAMTKAEDDLAEAKRKARTAESKAAYTEDTKQRIEEERKAARERAQQAKEAAAIQKKADAESMANQRRQIQIKSQLSAIDKNRITITKQSSDREKALAAQQQADYRSLQSELSKLIARQKELNAVSQGSGKRAKDRLSTYTISESEKAMRRYSDAVRNAHREQKKLGDETNKMLPTIQRLASAFGVAFSVRGLAQFGKKLIETRGEFEMQFVAMKQIIGDVDAATKIWNQTMQQALQSPKTFKELVTYTKQLAAYRVETEKLFDTTKRLADVSSGLGVEMSRLILAYGQVKSANFLRASEVRQFTEAGVNIVGNLAQYFTELEGRSVGTAEVMERITKRMVLFSDVEAIFKRMTDEGGEFYNMQEVQADTVKGQIQKLHDAYDQMLNTIGQANQGTIRNFVDTLNNLVRNWQDVAFVLKANINWITIFGASLYALSNKYMKGATTQTLWFSKALTGNGGVLLKEAGAVRLFGNEVGLLSVKQRIGVIAMRSFQGAIMAVGKALSMLWPLLVFEGITLLVERLTRANRELKRFKEELQEVASTNVGQMDEEINGYDSLIERLKRTTEGTMARKEVLDEISRRYGKYLDFIITEKTSVEQLAGAYDKVVSSIRNYTAEKIREEQQQKLEKGLYDEYQDLIKNLTGARVDIGDKTRKLSSEQAKRIAKIIQQELEKSGVLSPKDVQEILSTYFGETVYATLGGANTNILGYVGNYQDAFSSLKGELQEIRDDIEGTTPVFASEAEYEAYKRNVEAANAAILEQNKQYEERVRLTKETFRDTSEQWIIDDKIAKLRLENEEEVLRIRKEYGLVSEGQYNDELARLHGVLDTYEQDYNKRLETAMVSQYGIFWQTTNKEARDMYNFVVSTEQALQQGTSQRNKQLKESYKGFKDSLEQYNTQFEAAVNSGASKEALDKIQADIDLAKLMMTAIELAANLRGIDLSDKKKTTTRTTHENASKLISLIKEMRSEYDKLSKSAYGYAKSEEKVRDAYRQSYEDILKETGVAANFDFTTNQGEIEALKKVRDYIKGNAKYAKDAWKDVQKTIDQLTSETEIEISVRIREDFGKQMEKAFGDYELTLDIEKLNLPSDVLADMFDIETVDLSDLRNKVVQFYEERAAIEADPTELVKQVEGYYKKIDDMERKQQRERIKEYAKYLEYELSERAKIEMEYVRKSAEAETTRGLTKEQKDTIDKRLKKERDEKLAKQEWEDFKSSETYIQMMEDLEHQGVGALEVMRQELERIRANAANLSPRALKEVVNALEKINEITIKRGMPIGNILRANTGIASAKESAIGAGLEKEQVESRKAARETLENIKKTILEREKEYRTLSNELGVEKELARLESERTKNNAKMEAMFGETFAAESDEQIQQRIAEAVGNIETSRKKIAEYQEQAKEADEETLRTISTKVAEEESNLACLLAERGLLEDALRLRLAIAKAEANRGNLTDEERKHLQERVEQLEEELKSLQAQAGAVGSVTKAYGILGDTVQDAFQKMGQWGQQLSSTFDSFKTMMESFGTDTETSTWDTLSASFSMLDTVASTAASAAAKFTAGDYIGGALDVLNGLINIVTKINELHDKGYEREIERQQKRIESLQRAYERLEKQIEKTWSTVSYIRTYREETQNLYEQYEALTKQIRAEEAKKNTDKGKLQDYQDKQQEILDTLEEIKQQQIEVFGGVGEDNYRSAAEGFVDAWKSAFLETGDGLQGLQDHFDEFLQDWFVKQATMQGVAKYYQKVFDYINGVVEDGSVPTYQQIENARLLADEAALKSDELMQAIASIFGLGGEGSLSGLAAGIQGMTEEQANILEAYWNSVRGYTASIDMNVARIAEILGGGRDMSNPQLTYLESIARNTGAIYSFLQSVSKGGHAENGMGIKVFVN